MECVWNLSHRNKPHPPEGVTINLVLLEKFYDFIELEEAIILK